MGRVSKRKISSRKNAKKTEKNNENEVFNEAVVNEDSSEYMSIQQQEVPQMINRNKKLNVKLWNRFWVALDMYNNDSNYQEKLSFDCNLIFLTNYVKNDMLKSRDKKSFLASIFAQSSANIFKRFELAFRHLIESLLKPFLANISKLFTFITFENRLNMVGCMLFRLEDRFAARLRLANSSSIVGFYLGVCCVVSCFYQIKVKKRYFAKHILNLAESFTVLKCLKLAFRIYLILKLGKFREKNFTDKIDNICSSFIKTSSGVTCPKNQKELVPFKNIQGFIQIIPGDLKISIIDQIFSENNPNIFVQNVI
ncbi:hypothetical protein BpHYR1_003368 [Brachionus plicatilis]|uniref:Uncharacterized protein n=1 Tax=Brachionus plicatilis TaxID=10195 RepID=A0A3M7SII9_BRAPC|nr:hypothetical protein BpHYR1_003368 [Brachionus plicatilis]